MWIRRAAVFLGAIALYLVCLDRGASLWDCPEYILSAWRLEIGHPPGNPTWQLMANAVAHLGGSPAHAAVIINFLSALSMALAAAFLSEIIYLLLRGSLLGESSGVRNSTLWANLCGACGALCYAWCDSAIFSAVEAEVYALSAMFTALMVLLSLRWAIARSRGETGKSRRIIILTAYLAGLGVGVHELNFLALPAMGLVYWYGLRSYPSLQPAKKKASRLASALPTALWSLVLFLVGTATFILIPIRAAANPPVNTGNPSTWERFLSYYNRDQYGSKPLLYGPTPYSQPLLYENHDTLTGAYDYSRYFLTEGKRGRKTYTYPDELNMWFPRMTGSSDNDLEFYEMWTGMNPETMVPVEASVAADSAGNQLGRINPATGQREKRHSYRPTYGQQVQYFLKYQVGFMYMRYLLWNFSGRQNNLTAHGGTLNGNFITGLPAIDDAMLGPQDKLPPEMHEDNRGYNRYFLIPLLFGLAGIAALCAGGKRGRRVCAVIATLFLFTGVLIVVYLNQGPGEPRDRDYSFLGSYMAFAMWIACGMAALIKGLTGIVRKEGPARRCMQGLAALICLGVPLQMLSQTYDDHYRPAQTGAEEVIATVLTDVEPGAILMGYGDNVIFPLWYGQEVLGIRRDITLVALPYLTSDWYRQSLRIPGEGAPGLSLSDSIPPGPGRTLDRAVDDLIRLNPSRPVYRAEIVAPATLLERDSLSM